MRWIDVVYDGIHMVVGHLNCINSKSCDAVPLKDHILSIMLG